MQKTLVAARAMASSPALLVLLCCFASPLLAATPAASPPAQTAVISADGVQHVDMAMYSYRFSPAHLIVHAGVPVEMTLTNSATLIAHNFTLEDPGSGLSLHQDVGAGKTAVLRFTPPRAGSFSFYCDKRPPFFASHRNKGMEGVLEVR